jgi:hypothetical protein
MTIGRYLACAENPINPKLRAAVSSEQFAMLLPLMARNTQRGDNWDESHATMRMGMWAEKMEDWLRENPDTTDEQIGASAERYANFVGDPARYRWRNIFKGARLETELLVRTDLRTT